MKSWVYEYVAGDNSLLILLYGIATIFLIVAYVVPCYGVQSRGSLIMFNQDLALGKHINTFVRMLNHYSMRGIYKAASYTSGWGNTLYLQFYPLVFMISMAFYQLQ